MGPLREDLANLNWRLGQGGVWASVTVSLTSTPCPPEPALGKQEKEQDLFAIPSCSPLVFPAFIHLFDT